MASNKVFKTLSASTIQIVLNQFLGLVVFYLTSRFLSKDDYGELNWTIAFVSIVTAIIGLGTDYIILKRVASGQNIKQTIGLHIFHTLTAGLLLTFSIIIVKRAFPSFFEKHYLLTSVGISVLITFLTNPFKQLANGKEAFLQLAIMMVSNNMAKSLLLLTLLVSNTFTINKVVQIFILSSVVELITSVIIARKKFNVSIFPYFNGAQYRSLISEAFPQLGVMIFDSALARIDWIILGFATGPVATAEYSFTYKIFEISRLPMLILAPVILPKFIRYFGEEQLSTSKVDELNLLIRIEAFISVIIPIFFCISWIPLMGTITGGKYGTSCAPIYLILSAAVPLHYYTNFLWTMAFAQRQMKLTFYITVIVSVFNVIINLILIPKIGTVGAAIAFLLSTILQLCLYKSLVKQQSLKVKIQPLISGIIIAITAIFLARSLFANVFLATLFGLTFYLVVSFLTRLIRKEDLIQVKTLLRR